jgi:hypothetical protein
MSPATARKARVEMTDETDKKQKLIYSKAILESLGLSEADVIKNPHLIQQTLEDKILSQRPPGLSMDTLNREQHKEWGAESAAIWQAQTLRETVRRLEKFWDKWEFLWMRYPFRGLDDKEAALNIKNRLIKLAKHERLSVRISDYPDTFLGLKELVKNLARDLDASVTETQAENQKDNKTNEDFEFSLGDIRYNDKIISISVGRRQEIFKKLAENCGQTVDYITLDSSCVSLANEQLRTDITAIRKALKQAKIPFTIETKRTIGYCLKPKI